MIKRNEVISYRLLIFLVVLLITISGILYIQSSIQSTEVGLIDIVEPFEGKLNSLNLVG